MHRWSDGEISILKKHYADGGVKVVQEKGVNRTEEAIKMMATKLNIKLSDSTRARLKGEWTADELELLRLYYSSEGNDVQNRLQGRTIRAIQIKASQLGLKLNDSVKCVVLNRWTAQELSILKKYYKDYGAKYVKEKGVYRSNYAIVSKANKLGIKREVL